MKRKKAALYDPYLDTLGGGEKHILSILKVLSEEGFDINIFWNKNLSQEIKNKLNIDFNNPTTYLRNIFVNDNSFLNKLLTLRKFDYFFYVTDGSYFISTAKKNFIFCMVPKKELFKMGLLNKMKTHNYQFIANSQFTNKWLSSWAIKSQVIYPYLDQEFIDLAVNSVKKDKIILSVGRFFRHLHAKKQDIIINLFKQIQQNNPMFKDFRLILAGGLKEEDKDYYSYLQELIGNQNSIILKPNLSYSELIKLYKESLIYWHLAGFGIDENEHPELVEHLGITPLEAMASGCITFCFNAGGPKEIIKDNNNGFLFNNEDELIAKTTKIILDTGLQAMIQNQAKKFVTTNFSYEVFQKRVKEVIL